MANWRRNTMFLVLGTVLLIMTACSTTAGSNGQSVAQLLQKSSTAMKDLKSAHFMFDANAALQSAAAANTQAKNFTFKVSASGDEAAPDKSSLKVNLGENSLGLKGTYGVITLGDKLYIQDTQGKWYVLDKSSMKHKDTVPGSSKDDLNNLLDAAQKAATFTDHGTESLHGENLHHVTIALDKAGVQQILKNDSKLSSQIGQENIDKLLNSTKSFQGSVDLWIDDATSYVHQAEVKVNLNMDLSSLQGQLTPPAGTNGTLPGSVTLSLDMTTNVSKFNDPVNITAPANATPTDNPVTIFWS